MKWCVYISSSRLVMTGIRCATATSNLMQKLYFEFGEQ